MSLVLLLALVAAPEPPLSQKQVRTAIARGVEFLRKDQNKDGSWGSFREPRGVENTGWTNIGTHKAWTVGTTGVVCASLMHMGKEAPRDLLDRGIDFCIANAAVKRVSKWDVDNTWGYCYALEAVARALRLGLYRGTPREAALEATGKKLLSLLARHQTPGGGWGYYDDPPYTRRPTWATSFMTSAVVLALLEAREADLEVDAKMLRAAVRVLKKCRLPGGAFTYNVRAVPGPGSLVGINQVKGSLSRTQVGNLALFEARAGVEAADLRKGLDQFFKHHRFLAIGRGRPIPHEAWYAVAGYFFYFGHYYAAGVIEGLPEQEQARYWKQIAEKIVKTQEKDGSMWDFHSHRYHRPYGTAWGVSVLHRSLASIAAPTDSHSR